MLAQPPLCLECKNIRAITRQIGGTNKCTSIRIGFLKGYFIDMASVLSMMVRIWKESGQTILEIANFVDFRFWFVFSMIK